MTHEMTEDEFVRYYTQTLKNYEDKLTSTPEWQDDNARWQTLMSAEFKANAGPPDPQLWGSP